MLGAAVIRRPSRVIPAAVAVAAIAVFWRTAYPTITWWDSSSYSVAAATLGLLNAPGSLLLTLLGWPVAHLPLGVAPARALNLFAGVLAGVTTALVCVLALGLLRTAGVVKRGEPSGTLAAGAASGALGFAFSTTLWDHATKFTPYILTAVFTALILLTMLRWWTNADEPGAWRWILLLTFLFGLDFSVHRTNALLMPGALAWILIRRPRALLAPHSWLAGAGGMVAGLAVHLLVIPIAARTQSPVNFWQPDSLRRFWDYVSLAGQGGNFLLDLWPRKSGLWSVQVADLLRVARANFLPGHGSLGFAGLLSGVAFLVGITAVWRHHRRLAVAWMTVLLLHAAFTVLYFNIPAGYFRPFDRHYLPVFVTAAVLTTCGLAVLARTVSRLGAIRGWPVAALGAVVVALVPLSQVAANWKERDAAARYFTRDYAANALEGLPPNAIYFTAGDNDTFPVLYLQAVEGVRRDVRIVNLSLANTAWYIDQFRRRDPTFPVTLDARQRDSVAAGQLPDSIIVSVRGTGEQLGVVMPADAAANIVLHPKPMFGTERPLLFDVVVLEAVRTGAWQVPLTFAFTLGDNGTGWLRPYARTDGIFWRIVPARNPAVDPAILRGNLLERYVYRGYADMSLTLDDVTLRIGSLYFTAIDAFLASAESRGVAGECREAKAKLFALLPPQRFALPPTEQTRLDARCGS